MKIVVTGATGNVGTALLRALAAEPAVTEIVGIARRLPEHPAPKVHWVAADVATDRLDFSGADAVVHLAWRMQPTRDEAARWRVNVTGSRRVFEAAVESGVQTLVHASSIGAYSPGPPDGTRVREDWPTDGVPTSSYSRMKSYCERLLDAVEARAERLRVVRLRPALVFQPAAATQVRRYFGGPFVPTSLLRRFGLPVWPATHGLDLQAVSADDVAQAYRLALVRPVRGAFNVAAEPVLDPSTVARALRAVQVPVPRAALRAAAAVTWHLRLQPTSPGWADLAMNAPLLDTTRVRTELGWTERVPADELLARFVEAVGRRTDHPTPPLRAESSGPARSAEIAGGVGGSMR